MGSTKRGEYYQRLDIGGLGDQAIPYLTGLAFEPLFGEPQKILDDRFARDFRPGGEKCKGAHPGAPAILIGIAIQNEPLDGRQVSVTHGREDPRAILGDDIAADRDAGILRE